jgi:general secretion pathway protein G
LLRNFAQRLRFHVSARTRWRGILPGEPPFIRLARYMPLSYPVLAYDSKTTSNTQPKGPLMNLQHVNSTTGRAHSSLRRGFTLVELLVVLTILAILAGIVIPNYVGRTEEARKIAARMEIAHFVTALNMFEVDNGYLPKGADGLQSLMVKPRDALTTWKGPYLQKDRVPLDPWKHPYVYEFPGKHNPAGYDLYTKGRDGLGGANTIGNWTTD